MGMGYIRLWLIKRLLNSERRSRRAQLLMNIEAKGYDHYKPQVPRMVECDLAEDLGFTPIMWDYQ